MNYLGIKSKSGNVINPKAMIVLFVFLTFGCEKEETSDFIDQAKISVEYVKAEDHMMKLFVVFQKSIYDTVLLSKGEDEIDGVYVSYFSDTVSGAGTFIFDFGVLTTQKSITASYFGQIVAQLDQPFENENALFHATFSNFIANAITLTGELVYQNTGELVAGEKKFVLSYDISTYANENKIIAVEAQRDLYWVDGYITPYQPYDDEFEMTGGANANYYNHVLTGTPDVPMSIVFTMDWKIKTICDNPISQGTFDISLFPDGSEILLRGEFIDTDQDDCSDKVLIKNFADTYAFPYYL